MELTFPFRNITFNTLLDFLTEESVREYISSKDYDSFEDSFFFKNTETYKDYIPSFENEILQICETTNQQTIDYLFELLADDIKTIKESFTREELSKRIDEWNENELKRFEDSVALKVESFLQHPNRKLKHLEQYEPNVQEFYKLIVPIHEKSKTKAVNHNFYCIEEVPKIIEDSVVDEYLQVCKPLTSLYISTISTYGKAWQKGEIKSKAVTSTIKPIVFFEGAIDVDYIKHAAVLLKKEDLLKSFDFRYRGGAGKLDKLWTTITTDNWETVVQKKILIYDCDKPKAPEDFGYMHKRSLPQIEKHPVKKGIENLFSINTIQKAIDHKRAFIDYTMYEGYRRGEKYKLEEFQVNEDEKRNLCSWLCANGTAEDFEHFKVIFTIIEKIPK